MSESLMGRIRSELNVADLLTKVLFGQKRKYLVGQVLYDIYEIFIYLFFGFVSGANLMSLGSGMSLRGLRKGGRSRACASRYLI